MLSIYQEILLVLRRSISVNVIFDKDLSVLGWGTDGNSLPLSILDTVICTISLLLWKDFSPDQYVLRLVDEFVNFFDKKKQYLCLDGSMETPSKFWGEWKFSQC